MNTFKMLTVFSVLWLLASGGYASTPDIRAIAAKEMGIATQSMKSFDTNFDGKKDRFDYYERGNLVTIEYDYDEDGKIDERDVVKDGIIVERDILKDGKTIFVVNDSTLVDKVKPASSQK